MVEGDKDMIGKKVEEGIKNRSLFTCIKKGVFSKVYTIDNA